MGARRLKGNATRKTNKVDKSPYVTEGFEIPACIVEEAAKAEKSLWSKSANAGEVPPPQNLLVEQVSAAWQVLFDGGKIFFSSVMEGVRKL